MMRNCWQIHLLWRSIVVSTPPLRRQTLYNGWGETMMDFNLPR